MAPYGERDDDSESTASFSIMGDEEGQLSHHVDSLKGEIQSYLSRNNKCYNILMVGAPGVGKSALINSFATALAGNFHTFVPSGHHGGAGRPMNFFMKSYTNCCLDEVYGEPYKDVCLPTLVDMAGLPNENNKSVYEEILRTVYYGRLPRSVSLAKAEDIAKAEGLEGLRKMCPKSYPEMKIDRIIFVASAKERTIPEELIKGVVNTCRPSGTADNPRKRTIPLTCVITKMDKVDEKSSEFLDFEKNVLGCLGLLGSEHLVLRCRNYCNETAPERTDHNYPELDVDILKFFKQLVDPFLSVDFDEELEDFSHLNPQQPATVSPDSIKKFLDPLVASVGGKSLLLFVIGTLMLLIWAMLVIRGPVVNMTALQTTCLRVKDLTTNYAHDANCLKDLPELGAVCESLVAPCSYHWLLISAVGLLSLGFFYTRQTSTGPRSIGLRH